MSASKTGKFIDYSNQISNLIWALLIGIVITNVYIIQRSLHWNQIVKEKVGISLSDDYSDPDYMTVFWETLQQEQSRFNGIQTTLRFNYGSLSLLWPVIILVIYIIIYFLIKRHYSIAKTIVDIDADFDKRIISKYPLIPLYGKNFTPTFFYLIVLFMLPICAFAIHGFSGIKVTNEILANVNEVVEKNHLRSDHAIYDLVNSFKFFFRIQFITTLIVFIPLIINNYSLFKLTRKEL